MLDQAGVRCEVEASVVAVMERLVTGTGIDLILLADRTPGADEVLAAAARSDGRPAIPVVMLATLLGRATSHRAAAVLTKPVRRLSLHRTLSHVFCPGTVGVEIAPPPSAQRAGWRLLLVEDNSINQRVALAILARLGYRADTVANGREAVTALCRAPYDLVLMDCQMPEMDGYEATRAIRAEGSPVLNRTVPVIAMTANAMTGDRDQCLKAGMDDYLVKPINSKLLAECLALHLAKLPLPDSSSDAIDWREFVDRLGGDEPLARELIAQFCSDILPRLDRARAAHRAKDAVALTRILHGLKGAAANFSAKKLHCATIEAEAALVRGFDMNGYFSVLADEIKAVLAESSRYIYCGPESYKSPP
jgi:CheY-like chemotaxis protein/HPt (histidine-containing phosphotransfer) domain-containing protein